VLSATRRPFDVDPATCLTPFADGASSTASPVSITAQDRKGLVQNILDDIEADAISKKDHRRFCALSVLRVLRWDSVENSNPDAVPRFLALPLNDRTPRTCAHLASSQNPSAVSGEALRCVANALLLVDAGRDAWLDVGGGQLCLQYLQDPKTSEEFSFLVGRILFLTTLKQCPFLKECAEDEKIIESIAKRCDMLLDANVSGVPFAKDALTDTLKFVFNLMLQYPRMIDTEGSQKVLVTPLVRMFTALPVSKPPLVAPLTHDIHALLNIPVIQYADKFFPPVSSSDKNSKGKKRAETPPGTSLNGTVKEGKSPSSFVTDPFQRAMSLLSSQRKSFGGGPKPDPPRRSTSSTSASSSHSPSRSGNGSELPTPARARSSSPTSSTRTSNGSSSSSTTNYQIVNHACAMLDLTLSTYWPDKTEADSPSVRSKAKQEGMNLDENITPLAALLVRLAEHPGARVELRNWILPENLDRSEALEGRGDTLGRILRIMSCVYYPRLKDALGEFMYTICDSDGSILSAQIGYGNAAGYLFNKGILSGPPPPPSSSGSSGGSGAASSIPDNVNPITGAINREVEDDGPEMTEEEKEREAEKLFVLFDRLEKSGMVAENPVRKAIQEGKISMGPFGP
ncbi:1563_t:CDS:2, partial [Acaulospora colombiana]